MKPKAGIGPRRMTPLEQHREGRAPEGMSETDTKEGSRGGKEGRVGGGGGGKKRQKTSTWSNMGKGRGG